MTKGYARRIGTALCGTGMLMLALGAGAYFAHAAGATVTDNHGDKVWVCKYVGKPGVDEHLKAGKNPIHVNDAATGESEVIGASFADAQGRSVIVAGDVECPSGQVTTTTTTTQPQCDEDCPTTTTTVAPTTTTVPITTTTAPATTTTAPVGTTTTPAPPKHHTAALVPATTPPAKPSLPFTGGDTLPLLGVGLALTGAGVAIARKAAVR